MPAHEWNVWFWCVRGRVVWAIYRDGARHSMPVSKSFGPRPAHTPYGACSRMERLVLVCSRSSGLGDLSRWGKALHARQQV
ncbi:MAG: hypothetical protein ACOVNV_03170, partial [Pirellulaceae bacterium]